MLHAHLRSAGRARRAAAGLLTLLLATALVAVPTGTATATSPTAATVAAADDPLPALPQPVGNQLHVMSFNLRFASATGANSWPQRRAAMREVIAQERPHVIGTQEGVYQQLRDMEADQDGRYRTIGTGRDGGSRGEFMMVFYDHTRLDPLAYDHYWLSDTPDVVGSSGWGGCCARMVTWVRFLDRRTGEQFYFLNTHFEAFSAEARQKSAALVLERMAGDFEPSLPVVATGDFNEAAGAASPVYGDLVTAGPLVDTWETAEQRGEAWGTFPNYGPMVVGGNRIDWILTTPEVRTVAAYINPFALDGQYPSDHVPVQALLLLDDTDVTPPTIDVTGVEDSASYGDSAQVAVGFSATDEGGTGVAAVTATLDGAPVEDGTALDLPWLPLGEHTLVVIATDNAGNVGELAVTFSVETSFADVDALLTRLVERDRLSPRVEAGLRDRLERAEAAAADGAEAHATAYLEQFVARARNQVRGDADDVAARDLLVRDAEALQAAIADA
jgi:endonuclease/exonuclease/phosphatase family metal-dependent hydrolase